VRLGALVTHRAIERCAAFQGGCAASWRAPRSWVDTRSATWDGGRNIVNASPAADVVPVLLALDAAVTCVGAGGERTMALEEFLMDPGRTARWPGELLTAVRFAVPEGLAATAFLKRAGAGPWRFRWCVSPPGSRSTPRANAAWTRALRWRGGADHVAGARGRAVA